MRIIRVLLVELPLIWYPGYQAVMDGEELMVGASGTVWAG